MNYEEAQEQEKLYWKTAWSDPSQRSVAEAHWQPFVRLIDREYPYRREVIDIGCGVYGLGAFLKDRHVYAVDPLADWFVDNFDVNKNVKWVSGSGEKLPFADASIDLVICTTTLEHVLHPEMVLAEAYRVLRNRGILFWSENTSGLVGYYLKRLHHILGLNSPAELHVFNERAMIRMLDWFGFQVVEKRKCLVDIAVAADKTNKVSMMDGFLIKLRSIRQRDGIGEAAKYALAVWTGGRHYSGDALIIAEKAKGGEVCPRMSRDTLSILPSLSMS